MDLGGLQGLPEESTTYWCSELGLQNADSPIQECNCLFCRLDLEELGDRGCESLRLGKSWDAKKASGSGQGVSTGGFPEAGVQWESKARDIMGVRRRRNDVKMELGRVRKQGLDKRALTLCWEGP